MRPESRSGPLLDCSSVRNMPLPLIWHKQYSLNCWSTVATELHAYRTQRIHEQQTGTFEGFDFYTVLPKLWKESNGQKKERERGIPCGGGVEYLNRNIASLMRWRKGKSRFWDSKLWSRVPWESDPKLSALARPRSNCKRQIRPLVRERAPHQQTSNCLTVIKIWS
jgi:hypothetical protein